MKIAILIDLVVPGGVQKAAIEETRVLKKLGHKTQLFTLIKTNYDYQYQDLLRGLKINYLSDKNPFPFKKARKLPFFSFLTTSHLLAPFFAKRYKKLNNFDLIISHGTTTCFTALAVKKTFNVPYFAFIWDPMDFILHKVYKDTPLGFFFPLFDKLIFHLQRGILLGASAIITPSNVHKNHLSNIYGVKPHVIHPGHNFKVKNIARNRKYILGYSRWQKEKNPDFFLKLAKKVKVPIVLAGLWTNKIDLQNFKEKLNQQKLNIKIIESVKQQDIPKLARDAIAWVHPNFEAFGMPGLELAAHGVPIIIPKGSGVTELFEHQKHGFFPPKQQWDKMILVVQLLVDNPKLAQRLGKNAAKVAKQYTWKKHASQLVKLIKQSQPKTITILNNAYVSSKNLGGGDRYIQEVARRLPNRNFRLITPRIGYLHWKKLKTKNILPHVLKQNLFDGYEITFFLFFAYLIRSFRAIKLLKQISPSLVFSTSDIIPDIIPAYIYKKFNPNVRWLVHIGHLYSPPYKRGGNYIVNTVSWMMQRANLKMMKNCDRILADNTNLKDQLANQGFRKNAIEIHPGGVDIQKINDYKPQTRRKYTAAFVGRLTTHKGVFDLIPIWKQITEKLPDATLAIIGTGDKKTLDKLNRQINDNNLKGNIFLLGFLKHQKGKIMPIFDVMKNSKILLFTDHEAGFGLSVAEAMATGLPIVAYNLPIFGTTYKKGYLTAPLGNKNEFANQVLNLLSNSKLYKKTSLNAKKQVRQFDWKIAAYKFDETLKNL